MIYHVKTRRCSEAPFISAIWGLIARLETFAVVPITAVITIPLLAYFLVKRGYCAALLGSQLGS